jgi:predicted hydrocarbon binding protein
MMGVISNLLAQMIEKMKGKVGKEKFLEKAGFPKGFKNTKIYSNNNWQMIVAAAVEITGFKSEELQEKFAKFVLPVIKKKFGFYFEMSSDALSFLGKIPNVHQMWPGKGSNKEEKFEKIKADKKEVIFKYKSPNMLCIFIKSLALEIFKYYNEKPIIKENSCMLKGDEYCEFSFKSGGKEYENKIASIN